MKTTIKKIVSALSILALISTAKAQIFSGGIIGGASTGAVRIDNIGTGFTGVIEGNNITGFEIGLYAKFQLSPFYIKPMAMYNASAGQVSYQTNGGGTVYTNFSFQKGEVPVLFGFNIIGRYLSIEAGPVYNYMIASTTNYNDYNVTLQRNGIGYRAGLASELGALILYAAYGGAVFNSSGVNNATFREPNKLVFGVGLKFGQVSRNGSDKDDKD